MKLESFIARRIYGHNDGKRYTRSASLIAIFGIAVGLVVMLLSVAIVRGFKHEVAGKVMGFGSQLQVLSITQNAQYEVLPVVTNDSMLRVIRNTKGVAHAQLFASKTGLFKTSEDFCGMQFRGVGEDYDTTFLHKYLVAGQLPRFSSTQSSNQVLISEITAKLLNLQVGQRVFAYFYSEGGLRARRFTVSGIYNTHLTDYDRQTCFTDIRTVRRLNNWEADESSGVEMTKDEGVASTDLSRTLNQALGHRPDRSGAQCAVFTTEELAPGLFAWLDVLDVNVAMILALMMVIGSFTIVSGILIIMLERIQMIGVLSALGASASRIRGIFRHFSYMLLVRALFWGNLIALTLCFLQKRYSLIALDADTYYIDAVPIRVLPLDVIGINVGVALISMFIILISTFFISLKRPASAIRWE